MSGAETATVATGTVASTISKYWPAITNALFILGIAVFIIAQLVMSSRLIDLSEFLDLKKYLPSIIVPSIIGSFVLFIASYLYFQQMTSNVVLMNVILVFACLSVIMSFGAIGFLSIT
jgi:hypothetical protein